MMEVKVLGGLGNLARLTTLYLFFPFTPSFSALFVTKRKDCHDEYVMDNTAIIINRWVCIVIYEIKYAFSMTRR